MGYWRFKSPLRCAAPASESSEQEIINALLKELNARLALHLDTVVSFDRNPAALAIKRDRNIVVGASNASRTADALADIGSSVVKLTVPGWRITRPKVAEMAAKLQAALAAEDPDCVVVFEMFDANFFLARTEDGGMVPICKRGTNSEFHVDGDLVFAPKELQYSVFCDAKPLFEAASSWRKVIISPISRYLLQGCCTDPDHVGNRCDPDYKACLESAVVESRKLLKDFCFRQGIRIVRVVGPWPSLRTVGDSIWADQVHLSPQGYAMMSDMAVGAAADLLEKPEPASGRGQKRGRDGDFHGAGNGTAREGAGRLAAPAPTGSTPAAAGNKLPPLRYGFKPSECLFLIVFVAFFISFFLAPSN